MRRIFTLVVLFFYCSIVFGQDGVKVEKVSPQISISEALNNKVGFCGLAVTQIPKIDTEKVTIRLRCHSTRSNTEPLYVIDGVPQEPSTLKNLNPNDIESIEIIKEIDATAIFSCGPRRGIILITTKSSKLRQFTVKDFLDGSKIEGATVTFISAKDRKDTLMFVADDEGLIETNRLKPGVEYEVNVSAVGYKKYSAQYKNTIVRQSELVLERSIKNCTDVVVVVGYGHRRVGCRLLCCVTKGLIVNEVFDERTTGNIFRAYPNPAQQGQSINIEILSDNNKAIQVKITDLSGKQLLSQTNKSIKGTNRFIINTDSRWTAGIYIVQVQDESGKLMQQQKLLIQ